MTSKPSFDFIDAPRQKLHAADRDQRELGLQPDAAAETWRLGDEQGLAPELALRNAADVRAEAERQRLDKLATDAPAVADWLAAKPERLAIARDDLETMGLFEKMYRNLVPKGAGTAYVDTTMRAPVSGGLGYVGQVLTGAGDLWDSAVRTVDRGVRAVVGPNLPGDGQELPWWLNPAEIVRRPGQDLRTIAGDIGVPDERQNFATDVTGGVGQLGGMTLQAMLAPQTSVPSLFALGASQQADEAREAGVLGTPAADDAVLLGAPTTAALERFGIEKLLNRLPPKIKNDAARWLADKGLAFAYEGGQEVVEGLAQDVIGANTFDPERKIGEGLTYEGIVAGTSAGIVRTLLGVRSPLRPVVESAEDVAKVEQLHALGGQLKTLDRNPAEVEALVRGIVDRSPGAPTHVYLDAEQLVTYFQSANLDPTQEIAQLTGDPDALGTAAAAGGDVVIPIERYVARAVKSPHAEAMKGLARLAADRASNSELESMDVGAMFDGLAPADPIEAAADPVAQVAAAVRGQLEAAGVEPSAAAAQAELLAQRYATRAERRGLGETALQVYEAAKVTIERPGEGPQPLGARLEQPTRPDEIPTGIDPETRVPVVALETVTDAPENLYAVSKQLLRDSQGDAPVLAPDGTPIRFSRGGRGKMLSKGRRDPIRQAVARAIPRLIASAPIHSTAAATGADAADLSYAYASAAVQYEGSVYPVRLIYRVGGDGQARTYDFEGFEMTGPAEAGPDLGAIERRGNSEVDAVRGPPQTALTVAELTAAFKGRPLFQPADGDRPRGQIILGRNGSRTIQLLEGANLSTFHHETGHLFLDELLEDAYTEGASPQLRADLDLLLGWWGVKARTKDGRAAVVAEATRVVNHEKFARGYEAYLREGKAPAPGLAELFGRFRTWMISVYRQLRQLDIELSDEVRGVYDRLLATDDAIAAAKQTVGFVPLQVPPDLAGLVTEAQWQRYRAELEAATVEQRQAVEQKLLGAQQREAQAWWRDRRAEVVEQVRAEANSRPDFRAQSLLSRGKLPDGSDAPEGLADLSLSRAALVELYGERRVVDQLGPRKVYRKTGGVTPDAAAALLGYRDGAELVAALEAMPKPKDWIEGEADRRMREQYPDPLLDGSLPAEAVKEVHNDRQLALLATELGLLGTLARQNVPRGSKDNPLSRQLGAAARQRIAGMKPRNIRPNDYLVAERKSARLSTEAAAKGKFAEALRHKRQQTISAHLYRAALDATAEFDKARDYLRRFTRTDTRARLGKAGGSYLEQIDGLLELVEVRQVSGRAVERRQTLADWVERRAAEGESIDVPDAVLALTRLTNLRDMPMEQLRGLVDTVKQIDHLARLKTELLLGKERRDRAEVDAEMAASVRAARGGTPENKGDRTMGERAREAVNQGLGAYLRPSTLARDLDGFENSGAVWTHTVGIVQDAVNNQLTPALQQGQEALAGIWRTHYTDAELRRMNTAVSRGALGSWSKGRILSLALNWGNTGNREALLSQARKRLAPQQIGELLGTLDARDVAFLNDIWAHVDSYWPAIAEAQKRRTGLVPEKVEAAPFAITLADGTTAELNGGYFPLKYESEGDPKANQDEQTEFWDAIRTGRFTKAQTKNGHTKERVGSGGRTVRLDISVLGSHVRDVLRDVHLGDAVNYVHKTLQGPEFRAALSDVGKLEYGRALDLWLRDVATGEMAPRTFFERMGRKLRTNFTASLLGFNISSALIQPTGFLQSGASLGWGTLGTGLQRLIASPWTGPNSVGEAVDRVSPMMRARAHVSVEAVRKAEKALAGKRDGYVMRHAWVMMAKTQRIVDLATWLGAEAKGMDEFGGDVAKARAYADDAVQRAQASGEFADKSALERGTFGDNVRQSELLRGTTALMSYMIAKGNVVYERTRQTSFRNPGQVGRLAVDLTSLLVIENLLIAVLRGGLPSDEDEDGILDDAAAWFVKEGALGLLSTIPIVSQSATTLRGYDAQGVIERLSKTGKKLTEALWDYADEDEPLTRGDLKAGVSLVGMLTGLPAAQTNRVLDAYLANEEGEDIAAHEFLIGKRKE